MKTLFFSLLLVVSLVSCNAQKTTRADFDRSFKSYNESVRWRNMEDAGLFPADSISGEYKERARKAQNVAVVDYRITDVKYDDKKKEAEVKVEIDYYTLSSSRIRTLTDTQKWAYQEKEGIGLWRLMSLLPEFP